MYKILFVVFFIVVLIFCGIALDYSYPHKFVLPKLPMYKYFVLDTTGILFGVRRLTADIAWIQLLQYYGTPEEHKHHTEYEEHRHDFGGGCYFDLLKLCQRVIRLDPYFLSAYLYGGAALAWNLNREEEGLLLLKEGAENDSLRKFPDYWQIILYIQAVTFKKLDKFNQMVATLEKAIKQPTCPTMVKAILANIYKHNGNYTRAIDLWKEILLSKDTSYRVRAEKQIKELNTLLRKE